MLSDGCIAMCAVQRPPLTVEQLQVVETLVIDTDRSHYDRVAAGFILVLTYRLRFSSRPEHHGLEFDVAEGDDGNLHSYPEQSQF